jgi:hypothetical protein
VCTGPGKVKTQCKKNDQNEVKSQKIEEKGKLKEGGASDPDTLGLGWQNPTPKTGGFSAESIGHRDFCGISTFGLGPLAQP